MARYPGVPTDKRRSWGPFVIAPSMATVSPGAQPKDRLVGVDEGADRLRVGSGGLGRAVHASPKSPGWFRSSRSIG